MMEAFCSLLCISALDRTAELQAATGTVYYKLHMLEIAEIFQWLFEKGTEKNEKSWLQSVCLSSKTYLAVCCCSWYSLTMTSLHFRFPYIEYFFLKGWNKLRSVFKQFMWYYRVTTALSGVFLFHLWALANSRSLQSYWSLHPRGKFSKSFLLNDITTTLIWRSLWGCKVAAWCEMSILSLDRSMDQNDQFYSTSLWKNVDPSLTEHLVFNKVCIFF